ncbi:MAG TPA: transglutaminase-like domain-containing protein [Gemmatimonadales bacterium]|nr:transglutaminase-like domain-containing protein [Gemmatimonadales bacterium]
MKRGIIGRLVLLAWLGALGWLAWRQLSSGQPQPRAGLPWLVPPGASFLAATIADSQMGIASFIVDTGEAGLRVDELLRLDPVPGYGAPSRQLMKISSRLTRDFRLRSWSATVTERLSVTTTEGTISGDTLITVIRTSNNGEADTLRRRMEGPVLTPGAIGLRLAARQEVHIGDTLQVRVFDHVDLSTRLRLETVAAESTFIVPDSAVGDSAADRWVIARYDTVQAWRLDAVEDGLPIRRWIDPNGLPVRVWNPLGVTLQRGVYEILAINYRIERGIRPRPASFAPVPARLDTIAGTRPTDGSRSFRLVLWGGGAFPALPLPALTDGPQQLFGDTVVTGGGARPLARRGRDTVEAMSDELLVPLKDSAITAAARGAAAGESDRAAAARLVAWVAKNIKLVPGDGVTLRDPRHTLQRREGDGHARLLLFLAMARSVGIPARSVSGLLAVGDGYRYHDWAEVYASGWIAVDPAFGQSQADPGRIRLVTGRLARESDQVWRLGALRPQPTIRP